MRWTRLLPAALLVALAPGPGALADPPKPRAPVLRLVHLRDGLAPEAPDDDPARIPETKTYEDAKKRGIDLLAPAHPLLAHRWTNGRLWYLFYKVVEDAFGDRPYVIQRIRKTERSWSTADSTPEEKVTYQVEAFKTIAGTLKRPDRHFGDFGHQGMHRREIVKEYEIGFGEVRGACEGPAWPFGDDSLFHMIQEYSPERAVYERTTFRASTRWTLEVSLEKSGVHRIRSPELGIDAPTSLPDASSASPKPDEASRAVVLEPAAGLEGARLGESTAEDLQRAFGDPLESIPVGRGHRNVSFARSLTFNLDPSGRLNTVITRPGFAGRTRSGVSHGDTRAQVTERLGPPVSQRADAVTWRYDGLQLTFDGFDRVSRIVLFRPR